MKLNAQETESKCLFDEISTKRPPFHASNDSHIAYHEVKFEPEDAYWHEGGGVVLIGKCPFDLETHNELNGQTILCNERRGYYVRATETFAKSTPPRKGEAIGLLV